MDLQTLLGWGMGVGLLAMGVAALIFILRQGRDRALRYRTLKRQLAELGFAAEGKVMVLREGESLVLARSDNTDLRMPRLRYPWDVYPRDPQQTTHGFTGDEAFDQVFYTRNKHKKWSFHGLSGAMRTTLLQLSTLGRVSVGAHGLELELHDPERGVPEVVGRLVELSRLQLDLAEVVRTDPCDVVAAHALRALFATDPAQATALAEEVVREDPQWRGERARLVHDVETLAACVAAWPDETRLLDQLRGEEVVEVLGLLADPLQTMASMRWGKLLPSSVPPPIGRFAWTVLHRALVDPELTLEQHGQAVALWPCAEPHLGQEDMVELLDVARGATGKLRRAALSRLEEVGGVEAVPHLQTLAETTESDQLRGLARHHIDNLLEAHSDLRGGVSLADASGGGLAVAVSAPRDEVASTSKERRRVPDRQGTTGT